MSTFGYSVVDHVGQSIRVAADSRPEVKVGGITINWAAVVAASADYEVRPAGETADTSFLSNGGPADDYVTSGEKFLRYGTVMCRLSGGTYDGKFVPYGAATGLGSGTILKTRSDMYILNESVHENAINSDHSCGGALIGGSLWKYRIVANWANVQTITFTATGGTFTVTYNGQTTTAVAYNASTATLQAALVALSTIGTGNAVVTGSAGAYVITLADALGVPYAFTISTVSLTGVTGTPAVGTSADTLAGPTKAEFEAAFPRVDLINEV